LCATAVGAAQSAPRRRQRRLDIERSVSAGPARREDGFDQAAFSSGARRRARAAAPAEVLGRLRRSIASGSS
jgi:hypothetical protein